MDVENGNGNGDQLDEMARDTVEIWYLKLSNQDKALVDSNIQILVDEIPGAGRTTAKEIIYALGLMINKEARK